MKYKIQYNYNTGDSFRTEKGLKNFLDMTWENLDIVKANLLRIKEHYEQHSELNGYRWDSDKTNEEIIEENKNKDWFVKVIKDCVYYKDENGKETYQCIDKSRIKLYKDNKDYRVDTFIDRSTAEDNIILYTDEGKPWQFYAPWCGYFESLNNVEIIPDNSDMKYEF